MLFPYCALSKPLNLYTCLSFRRRNVSLLPPTHATVNPYRTSAIVPLSPTFYQTQHHPSAKEIKQHVNQKFAPLTFYVTSLLTRLHKLYANTGCFCSPLFGFCRHIYDAVLTTFLATFQHYSIS